MVTMDDISEMKTFKKEEPNIAKEEITKNKRGTAVYMQFGVSKEEIDNCRYDIEEDTKLTASHQLGETIHKHLDIWEPLDKEPNTMKYLEARLVVIKEHDYKQMVGLINTVLKDSEIGDMEHGQVMELLMGIVK